MHNQTDDVKGIKTVSAVIIIAFFILAIMNVIEAIS